MIIGIVGGGASGMAAALAASENENNQVILFERQARLGKKLSATGNGRCNLTNLHADEGGFHGEQPEFVLPAMEKHSVTETLSWFRSMGLFTVAEESGRVYPYSDQANSVVDVLRFALEKHNIRVMTGCEITKAKKTNNGFLVETGDDTYECDRLIIACGGLAGTKLGGSMAGYQLLRSFGHKTTRLRPALVQLRSSWGGVVGLKGVRANCRAKILHNGTVFAESQGELQFTEYGLSGPVIFEISRDVCQSKGEWVCRLDFLPDIPAEDLEQELCRRTGTNLLVEDLLTGILHNRLGRVLTKTAGLRSADSVASLNAYQIGEICRIVKAFDVPLTEALGMDSAQVTAGGIMTDGFDPNTMESRQVPGLYACGEVLDIDGDCGGYNLQWAWSSGRLAGYRARKECI